MSISVSSPSISFNNFVLKVLGARSAIVHLGENLAVFSKWTRSLILDAMIDKGSSSGQSEGQLHFCLRVQVKAATFVNLGIPLRIFPHEKSNDVFWGVEAGVLGLGKEDKKDSSSECNLHFCFSSGLAALTPWREEILWSMVGRSRVTLEVPVKHEGGAAWKPQYWQK